MLRMYIDEVGNADLGNSEDINNRFLSLTGIIIDLEYSRKVLFPKIEELKYKYFNSHPDDNLVLHRKELVNARPPFEILQNPEIRYEFDNELLQLLNDLEYIIITICLDKLKHKETYSVWVFHPYHYCISMMLDRYIQFLNQNGSKGDVLAESRGKKEDSKLQDSYSRFFKNGNEYLKPEMIQNCLSSKNIKMKKKSENIAGLQLSDLLAHPSRNEILHENGFIEHLAPFAENIIKILATKYYQKNGRIFGKIFL